MGGEIAKKTWVFNIENQRHMVEVEWSRWSGGGKILVDSKIMDSWGKGLMQLLSEKHLEVADKPAVIRRKGRIFEVPELYVDGELIP
jgi:hypothetical protein